MRFRDTHYLDDGRGYNQGQPVRAIEVESPADFDAIVEHIARSDFYGRGYLERQSGIAEGLVVAHFYWLAEALARFRPRRVLEVGCGRGDVLRVLHELHGAEVVGIDVGSDVGERMWPSIRGSFRAGAAEDVLRDWDEAPFDLVCGFDVWEHIHPASLDRAIEAAVAAGTPDAWYVFVVPAFGNDAVFGERFPLELEENRAAFDAREPFRFLIPDLADPAVPAAGHLTWAHTDWWVDRFERYGLRRVPQVERELHKLLDPMVPDSVRALYVFRRRPGLDGAPSVRWPTGAFLLGLARRLRYSSTRGAAFDVSGGDQLERWRQRGATPIERRILSMVDPLRRAAGRLRR